MTNVNFTISLNANQIFNQLDAKDGYSDNTIKADIWNSFAKNVGGKSVKYSISKENAVKSINFYLSKMSDVQKNEIASILGAEFSQNPPKEEKIKDNLPQLENKSGDDIVNEMDAQDGKVDGLIRFEIWNPFAKKVGGKEIKYVIAKENALKSINYYLKKANNEIVEKTTVSNNDKMIKQNTQNSQKVVSNNILKQPFEKDTLKLNGLRFEHNTEFLRIAQDSLGLYEITAAEYEYLKKENPEELKNTQARIVGDFGMRNNHQWCAYTVGYLAQEAGMNIGKYSTVQGYINKYKNDYNQIQTTKMTAQNYAQERASRAEQIKAQLPKMNEGDFIIWKGNYVVPQVTGTVKNSTASHIGIIEHVDLENGVVTVIEGNANISEMNEYQERIPVKTSADCARGAQTFGEYKDVNNRDGLIRKQYTIEELSKHGYSGFIDNQARIK